MSPIEVVLSSIAVLSLSVSLSLVMVVFKMMLSNRNTLYALDSLEEAHESLREEHEGLDKIHQTLFDNYQVLEGQRDDAYKNLTMILSGIQEELNEDLEEEVDLNGNASNLTYHFEISPDGVIVDNMNDKTYAPDEPLDLETALKSRIETSLELEDEESTNPEKEDVK